MTFKQVKFWLLQIQETFGGNDYLLCGSMFMMKWLIVWMVKRGNVFGKEQTKCPCCCDLLAVGWLVEQGHTDAIH